MAITNYGDIGPRTAAYAAADLLERGLPFLILETFGQSKPLPANNSKTITFRRYKSLPATPKPITEGVTPPATKLESEDVSITLSQYGDRTTITDVIQDTHEDPVLQEAIDILGEQAAEMVELIRWGILKAGTNVFFAGSATQRTDVVAVVSLDLQRRVTRALKKQRARKITKAMGSSAAYAIVPVAASYIGICHTDCEADIKAMPGFVPVENYSQTTPYEAEFGKVDDVRYLSTQLCEPWADGGGTASGTISTSGTNADVYPILYLARDSYGIVALKGETAVVPMVVNPKPSDSDPMAQRGHVSWKTMQGAIILNQLWMARAEVAASSL